jgi:hypothetical protein
MNSDIIFEVDSPRGYGVVLSRERWIHIVSGHGSVLKDSIEEIKVTVSNPNVIFESKTPRGREVYIGESSTPMKYTRVIVYPPDKLSSKGIILLHLRQRQSERI